MSSRITGTILIIFAHLVWSEWTMAVPCSSAEYRLSTQAEVDALGAEGCNTVTGDLIIRFATDITNLDSLANLNSIQGSLIIDRNPFFDIGGLAHITTVGGALAVLDTPLTNLNGLSGITSVGSGLYIDDMDALTDLDSLSNITNINGSLRIQRNSALTSLAGLTNISSLGGYLRIRYNKALTNVDGLSNITSVGEDLRIDWNGAGYDGSFDCGGVALLIGWPNGPPSDNVGLSIHIGNNGYGCNSISEILASYTPPPSVSGRFKSLINAVQNARAAGSSQQQATAESAADTSVPKQEWGIAQARTAAPTGEPAPIPALPYYLLLIMSCLVGLFGLRRLRA